MTDDTRAGRLITPRSERAINAMPWEPPAGYAKRKCSACRFWFSTPVAKQRAECPDCEIAARRLRHGGPLRVVTKAKATQP